ncbi:hypothetical protein SPRG_05784 [Saprolegnia parasitica CBS 223.65]|uniref:MARVEL domain-containing protein n=1 Tax=Saprolegnia parasitica (strain CBS 223.65) TaxID=695850 RepID=A0A067CEH8_SAPPC|nr:hypothetical protein SPRG_05784 [Saprolegnia parasitica CBS 223.65]KDO28913.1 hypothetical protein SPRG_05784 [Saprolegnia parasitica CBS 223.65]|eukprot:XP_012200456.1 hypothetical protein SPRG_05784 [Saprolegnia parasitica CBS 223.65]
MPRRTALLILRGLHAIGGIVLVASTMLTYGTFTLVDGDRYRYAQTYQFVSVVVGYTSVQLGLLYLVGVGLLRQPSIDIVLERFVDGILALCSVVVGYMAQRKVASCDASMVSYQVACAGLDWSVAASFGLATLFALSLCYNCCVRRPSHPDAVENLVPRGNYGPQRCIPGSIPMLSPRGDDTTGRALASMDQDRTENLVPRGNFSLAEDDDIDKTEKLVPRGDFHL